MAHSDIGDNASDLTMDSITEFMCVMFTLLDDADPEIGLNDMYMSKVHVLNILSMS